MRGLRVRRNIWNLNIHLCWQTVEQQFIPAIVMLSAVSNNFRGFAMNKQSITRNNNHD